MFVTDVGNQTKIYLVRTEQNCMVIITTIIYGYIFCNQLYLLLYKNMFFGYKESSVLAYSTYVYL